AGGGGRAFGARPPVGSGRPMVHPRAVEGHGAPARSRGRWRRPAALEVLQAELSGAPAVECILGPATRWLGGQWLGAPVSGLDDLATVVFEVTEELVPVTHPQPFRADVVLARGRVPKALAGRPVSATWTARSVSLVADRSSPGAAGYEDLAVIPLGA